MNLFFFLFNDTVMVVLMKYQIFSAVDYIEKRELDKRLNKVQTVYTWVQWFTNISIIIFYIFTTVDELFEFVLPVFTLGVVCFNLGRALIDLVFYSPFLELHYLLQSLLQQKWRRELYHQCIQLYFVIFFLHIFSFYFLDTIWILEVYGIRVAEPLKIFHNYYYCSQIMSQTVIVFIFICTIEFNDQFFLKNEIRERKMRQ